MEILVLILCAVLVLFTLPAVVELTLFVFSNLILRFRLNRPGAGPSVTIRKLAVLVPAHNETTTIARCVRHLRESESGPYTAEVIVIADNCTDDTAHNAREAGARVIERFDTSVRGKGAALHYAISQILDEDHDAFVIVDADTVVSPNFVRVMGDQFSAGKEAVQCVYLALNVDATPKIRLMNLALLSMNVLRPLGRELLNCSVGIMGNGFGLTKTLLRDIPYTANSITEDLEYHLKLIEHGKRVRFVSETKVLADFPISKEGTETQRARWEGGRFLLQRRFFLPMLGKVLTGRGALVEPLLELMSLPLSYEVLLLLALVVLPYQPFAVYGAAGLALVAVQVLVSVLLHGTKKDFQALFAVPGYLFWKVLSLPRILLTSKKDAAWVRTKRD